jgi:hypothetical protein
MTDGKANKKLAEYIVDDLVDWMMQERRNLIEEQWRMNDDAFRGRYDSDTLKKWKAAEGQGWRSKVFVRLTKQKVVIGYNNLLAVMMQNGKLPYDIEPTPIPENMAGMVLPEVEAKARCDRMKKQIRDDLDECRAEHRYMTAAMVMSLYGMSWIRGPVLRKRRMARRVMNVPGFSFDLNPQLLSMYGRHTLEVQDVWRPVMEAVNPWNVFWDLENEDHQAGHGICIREMMSYGKFLDLASADGYDEAAVMAVIDQYRNDDGGEIDQSHGPYAEALLKRKRVIPVYEFYGRVPKRYLEGNDSVDLSRTNKNAKEIEIHCVIAKGKSPVVIRKPIVNPFCYRPVYRALWEEIPFEGGALSVPENMQDSQSMINGLVRSMMDNKALSSNLLIWWNGTKMAPGQNKTLYPGKTFETADHVEDVRQAMGFFAPPDNTGSTPELINMFERWASQETNLPDVLQGSTDQYQPDTAFEMSKLVESANKGIGSTVRNCDEGHIEPLITGFYDYHYVTNPDESIKGDYTVKATGFSSYQDKAVRGQNILSLANFALSNQLTTKFVKVVEFLRELARTRDIDPEKFFMTDDEIEQQAATMMAAQEQMAMAGGGPVGSPGVEAGGMPPGEQGMMP